MVDKMVTIPLNYKDVTLRNLNDGRNEQIENKDKSERLKLINFTFSCSEIK
jgi:hypothetical protein